MSAEIEIFTGNLNLKAKQWGNPDAEPILALHGWLDNAGSFDLIAPYLENINLIALDLPGHGLSEHRPPGAKYLLIDYLDDLLRVIDQLKLDNFILMGHSMGAGISSLFAGALPDMIKKLVLIDTLGPVCRKPEELPNITATALKRTNRRKSLALPSYKSFEAALNTRLKVNDIKEKGLRPILERGLIKKDDRFHWTRDPRLNLPSNFYFSEEQVSLYLKAIKAPTLLIEPNRGILRCRPGMLDRYRSVKNLTVYSLEGGHFPHLDHPKKVAKQINKFLDLN